MSTTLSRRLADWSAALRARDIPAQVRAAVPLRVLDHVGLAITGAATDAGRAIRAQAIAMGGVAEAAVVGGDQRLPAAQAALVHGTTSHCRDFDDTFLDSVVHPGSPVIAAALAVAEAVDAADDDFTAAVIAGYEIAARIGGLAGRRFHARQFHATGIVGPLAAAATASRLYGLDGERTAWAMGLTASMSGGLMAFMVDGGWSKWLHAGWAAHGGVLAAQLAARGFRGPEHVLDGGHDLYTAFLQNERVDRDALVAALGTRWDGEGAAFKYYPCAHVIQPYIDGLLDLMRAQRLAADDLAGVTCVIAPWAAAIVAEPRAAKLRFDSELEAIASLPYQLAVAAIEGRVGIDALTAAARARADYRALAERIVHRNDAALGRGFDGAIEITTRAGATLRRDVGAAPPDSAKLHAKFVQLVGPIRGEAAARTAADALLGDAGWRAAARTLAR